VGLALLGLGGPLLPQVPQAMLGDPNDFTGRYNTQLTPDEELAFKMWLTDLGAKNGRDVSRDMYDYDLRGAFKANAGQEDNGHFPDTFKKPNHPTFSSESQYSGVDGLTGGEWIKDRSGKWSFKASPSQLQFHSPAELRDYFKTREPDSLLILPR